jgi:hypothetical protein
MVQRAYRKENSQKRTAFLVVLLLEMEDAELEEEEAAPGGEKTFRNRQSSSCVGGQHMVRSLHSCGHPAPSTVVDFTPVHGTLGTGSCQRRASTGGSA